MAGPDFSDFSGPDFSDFEVPPQPDFLSRAKEQGLGFLQLIQQALSPGTPGTNAAMMNQLLDTGQGLREHPVNTVVSNLSGVNPLQAYTDYQNKNYGAAAADVVLPLGLMGLLHRMGGSGAGETRPQPTSFLTSAEAARNYPDLASRGPVIPERLALPAIGETSPASSGAGIRFFQGPAGIADSRMRYPIDLTDFAKISKPGTLLPSEHGELGELPTIDAANRTTLDVRDPAQLNGLRVPNSVSGIETKPASIQGVPREDLVSPGRTTALVDAHSLENLSRIADSNPAIANGDVIKPNPDLVNAHPVEPVVPSDLNLPRPGQIEPTPVSDINRWQSNFATPSRVLMNHPDTAEVVRPLLEANDLGTMWLQNINRQLADVTKGLNLTQRIALKDIAEGAQVPDPSGDLTQRASQLRTILDNLHSQVTGSIENISGEPEAAGGIGYIKDYITRMSQQDPTVASLAKYYFGKENPIYQLFAKPTIEDMTTSTAPIEESGVGTPSSPFLEKRTGNLENPEQDLNKILPAYAATLKRVIFDAPAVQKAKTALQNVPVNSLKYDLAKWTIKNYNGYDAEPQLHRAWDRWADPIATMTARSYFGLKPMLHILHTTAALQSIWPELGTKYSTYGVQKLLGDPINSWKELGQRGLIQGDVRPWSFKTPGERLDAIIHANNYIEKFVKGIGYFGAKQRAIDAGMSDAQATLKAIQDTKDMTYDTSRIRQMKGTSPESNWAGGELGSKTIWQGKRIPLKLVENIGDTIVNAKQNKGKAIRMAAGTAAVASVFGKKLYDETSGMLSPEGPFWSTVNRIRQAVNRVDPDSAIGEALAFIFPGGQQFRKLF